MLTDDLAVLGELIDATGETKIEAPGSALWHGLEAFCKLVTERLADEMTYGPVDMSACWI